MEKHSTRLVGVAILAALGLALSPVAAHAAGWRTASAQGSGPTAAAGSANAQNNAIAALNAQAAQAGEVCSSITSSATWVYTAPGGAAYVYNGTATGYCAVPPPYTVSRSATRQGGGSSAAAAQTAGFNAAKADILGVGVSCTNWSATYASVYTAPGGAWYIVNATVSALCTN
jgi:hypothetical protein